MNILYICVSNYLKMKYLLKLLFIAVVGVLPTVVQAQTESTIPGQDGHKEAVNYDYFPHRQYAFVWRNWAVVSKEKIAEILSTSVENVEALATSIGLPAEQNIEPEWATEQGYITVLRRNWHLLPYEQITQLLGMSREELKFRLIEDDFLFTKLGKIKPYCQPLSYVEPTAEMKARAARIATDVAPLAYAFTPEEPRFGFVREFEHLGKSEVKSAQNDNGFELRMIFPYCLTTTLQLTPRSCFAACRRWE